MTVELRRRALLQAGAAIAGSAVLPVAARADNSTAYEFTVKDLVYHRDGDKQSLARLYQPAGAGPFPAVLQVHGGAWNNKDRFANEPMDRAIAASGVLVVAIDMTLAREAPYPASVQDASYGIRWLRWKAPGWNGDPANLGVLGRSTGGYVAELLAMRPRDARYNAIPMPESPGMDE